MISGLEIMNLETNSTLILDYYWRSFQTSGFWISGILMYYKWKNHFFTMKGDVGMAESSKITQTRMLLLSVPVVHPCLHLSHSFIHD